MAEKAGNPYLYPAVVMMVVGMKVEERMVAVMIVVAVEKMVEVVVRKEEGKREVVMKAEGKMVVGIFAMRVAEEVT